MGHTIPISEQKRSNVNIHIRRNTTDHHVFVDNKEYLGTTEYIYFNDKYSPFRISPHTSYDFQDVTLEVGDFQSDQCVRIRKARSTDTLNSTMELLR